MRRIGRLPALLGMGLSLAGATAALAVEVSGETLPPVLTLSGQRLELAGCGTRESLFVDLYVIGLYVPDPPLARSRILDARTAKAVRLSIDFDGRVPDDVPEEWRRRLKDMVGQEIRRTLQGFYEEVKSGDEVTIAYAPESGTTMTINGETIVSTAGHEPIRAMLRLWIGEEPVSDNLRRLLLHGTCGSEDDWF